MRKRYCAKLDYLPRPDPDNSSESQRVYLSLVQALYHYPQISNTAQTHIEDISIPAAHIMSERIEVSGQYNNTKEIVLPLRPGAVSSKPLPPLPPPDLNKPLPPLPNEDSDAILSLWGLHRFSCSFDLE